MIIQKLTVTNTGPTWPITEFEIEGVDVMSLLEPDEDKVSVTVKDFPLSEDNTLNVFINQTGPNGIDYKISFSGEIKIDNRKRKISFESDTYTTKFSN